MRPASSASEIYQSVVAFFDACGGTDPKSAAVHCQENEFNLLRTACVGNPERTMQGALFSHLKRKYDHVVLEYRHHRFEDTDGKRWKNGRSIDIMVLDGSFNPLCAIELKHFSRLQGDLKPLLQGLDQDRQRLRGLTMPIIQVGLYTDLHSLPTSTRKDYENFRFISCYAFKGEKQIVSRIGDYASYHLKPECLRAWAKKYFVQSQLSFNGPPERFHCNAGPIAGRVHYFVGLDDRRTQPA
jgi:hypothetical protein